MRRWLARMTSGAGAAGAFAVAAACYGFSLAVCRLRPRHSRGMCGNAARIAVCGTFHNPNWFRSHLAPLARSGLKEVIVITDREQPAIQGVRVICRPPWLAAVIGRAPARLACALWVGLRVRPEVFMGYHLIPNSLIALIVGRFLSRATCYQMTTGPNEVDGGGFRSDNPVLSRLRRPFPPLERLALAAVREFDLVVVRGSGAGRYLSERGVADVAVITGSVDPKSFHPRLERPYDLLFVGQLIARKRPLEFVEILAEVTREIPGVRAVMVGDGVLMREVRARAAELGVADRVDFPGQTEEVHTLFNRARVFLLTSRSEGLSIAMAEAMMSGAVPVVANVGDLGDLVRSGVNGYLVEADDRSTFVRLTSNLLRDRELWKRLSRAAAESARAHSSLDRVAHLWATHLHTPIASSRSGVDTAER